MTQEFIGTFCGISVKVGDEFESSCLSYLKTEHGVCFENIILCRIIGIFQHVKITDNDIFSIKLIPSSSIAEIMAKHRQYHKISRDGQVLAEEHPPITLFGSAVVRLGDHIKIKSKDVEGHIHRISFLESDNNQPSNPMHMINAKSITIKQEDSLSYNTFHVGEIDSFSISPTHNSTPIIFPEPFPPLSRSRFSKACPSCSKILYYPQNACSSMDSMDNHAFWCPTCNNVTMERSKVKPKAPPKSPKIISEYQAKIVDNNNNFYILRKTFGR